MSSPTSSAPPVIEGTQPVVGAAALADLVALEPVPGGWRNRQCLRNVGGSVLGGQLAAHCLVAAGTDEPGFEPNALHILFIGGPDHRQPCRIEKDPLRSGRRLAHRSVRLQQDGMTLVQAQVTLQAMRQGSDASAAGPVFDPDRPDVPSPAALAPRAPAPDEANPLNIAMAAAHPFIEIRTTPGYVPGDSQIGGRRAYYWFRIPDSAGLSPLDHYALLTLVTDYWYTLPVHGIGDGPRPSYMTTSLDHLVWFHNRPDVSDWILVETDCALIERGIGHKRARLWSQDGTPLATVAQQSLVRSAPAVSPTE